MKMKRGALGALILLIISGLSYANTVDQPNMQAARADLQRARAALQRATQNKGGHRVNAIAYINSAIAEVNRGIVFDRRRHHAQALPTEIFSPLSINPVDQPNMKAALDNLLAAKRHLEAATSDKGGHRVKAIDYVNRAIDEVNRGIAVAS